MITNHQEFAVASRQLEGLKVRRDKMLREREQPGFELHVEVAGFEKMIARLQEEVAAFDISSAQAWRSQGSRA